jgi:serine/threonine protein phosphatase PrpC
MSEEKTQVKISGSTDKGMPRGYNQDFIGFNQDFGIAVLADGMGGHKAGEVAAEIAVATVLENLQKVSDKRTTGSLLLDYVSNTISDSNEKIYQASETDEGPKRMGTTVVAAIVKGFQVYAGHMGDSRLYLYRERALRRITKDHSLAHDLTDKGFYIEAEAREANVGHMVTRR